MREKKMDFEEACAWIADDVFEIDLPQASDSEIQIMQLAAREMVKQHKSEKP